jgi:hypothetical protein
MLPFILIVVENKHTVSNTLENDFISSGKQSTNPVLDKNIFQAIEKSSFDNEATTISSQH